MSEPKDALDTFVERAQQNPAIALAMLLWKDRLRTPEFTIMVTEKDLKAFEDCIEYLKVKPTVKIERPQGLPAQPPTPAVGSRRATPGRAAQPPKPFALIQMVDAEGNSFVAIENDQEAFDTAERAKALAALRQKAPIIASQLEVELSQNITSSDTQTQAIHILRTLATA